MAGQTANEVGGNELFEPGRVYTADEVAEKLRLSRSSVLSRARRGNLPCYKLGRAGTQRASVRFVGHELNEWLATLRSDGRPASAREQRLHAASQQERMKDFLRWRAERQGASAD